MYSEAVAKTMWCPEIRIQPTKQEDTESLLGKFISNRNEHSDEPNFSSYCIASECMAWRWFDGRKGYCGKAGKP